VWLVYEGVRRLITPPEVAGPLVLFHRAGRDRDRYRRRPVDQPRQPHQLERRGAFHHILNDLYAFTGTAIAGAVVWATAFARAEAIAALVVAGLMVKETPPARWTYWWSFRA
jgi:cobalt-zinc-cadmium efflux system protein